MLKILQWLCCVGGLLLWVAFFYQIVYLFVPFFVKRSSPVKTSGSRRYAILIAARNEEAVIGQLLESIRDQTHKNHNVYVIADNCTDRTAEIARQYGAVVYQRQNDRQVGKCYALQYLLEQMNRDGHWEQNDAFLIFDADNVLSSDYLEQLDRVVEQGYPVFTSYRNTKNFGDSWVAATHGLWYLHESSHLNHSRNLLNAGCMVSGTGYGFTRELLQELGGWRFFTLTEDIEFSTWCAVNGVKIGYAYDAVFYDEQPVTFRMSWRQRTRWSQGGIQTSFLYAGQYIKGIRRGGWSGWTSFEALTLSLWGWGSGGVCSALTLLCTLLSGGIHAFFDAVVPLLLGAYCSLALVALLTVLTEHRRIHATKRQILLGILTFPIFVASYLPISICCVFRKFSWPPIPHTRCVSIRQLQHR